MAETPFKLRSGNTPPFKQMGSTPAKHSPDDWGFKHGHKFHRGTIGGGPNDGQPAPGHESAAKHIGRHPSPKDGHEVAAHKEMGLFKALTGTKLGDVKVGKKPVEGEEDTRKSLKETKIGKQVSKTVSDIKDLGTDIKEKKKLGTTKKLRQSEIENPSEVVEPAVVSESEKKEPGKLSFRQAYRKHRDAGDKTFEWNGNTYTTESRSEKKERESN